jgi:hypothetical protein
MIARSLQTLHVRDDLGHFSDLVAWWWPPFSFEPGVKDSLEGSGRTSARFSVLGVSADSAACEEAPSLLSISVALTESVVPFTCSMY